MHSRLLAVGGLSVALLTAQMTSIHSEGEVYLNDQAVRARSIRIVSSAVARIRTGSGRAQIDLRDGSTVLVGPNARLEIDDNRPDNFTKLDILEGSVLIASRGHGPQVTCEDSVRLSESGLFRFTVQTYSDQTANQCRLSVVDGVAAVQLASLTAVLLTGEFMSLNRRCGDMIPKDRFDPTTFDDFERWARPLVSQPRAEMKQKPKE